MHQRAYSTLDSEPPVQVSDLCLGHAVDNVLLLQ